MNDERFKVGDIIVQIGHPQKWRILEVQSMTYRVEIVNGVSCVTSFNTPLADRKCVKVGVWDKDRGEIDDD